MSWNMPYYPEIEMEAHFYVEDMLLPSHTRVKLQSFQACLLDDHVISMRARHDEDVPIVANSTVYVPFYGALESTFLVLGSPCAHPCWSHALGTLPSDIVRSPLRAQSISQPALAATAVFGH
jgi:hypothetical protein